MDRYIGKLLDGRYEILETIGVGGMAVVYKARCRLLDRYVAIKVLKDEYALDNEFRRRFYNESQAVAKLSHHNIVSIYDVSHKEGLEYIVMELVEGITLKQYLEKKGNLSWQESLFFAQQIAKALSHAHSRGIIHQDIKPQNILLINDGTAKVTDFGIARFQKAQETKVIQEAIGSVHYISPEQAKGGTIDYRTDIYSLGVVLYEMLTGKLPFQGENAVSIVMQHMNALPPMPSEVVPDIPTGMDEIVMKAMSPVVSRRYLSADEIYDDLTRLKQNPDLDINYKTDTCRGDNLAKTQPLRYSEQLNAMEENDMDNRKTSKNNEDEHDNTHIKKAIIGVFGFVIVAFIISMLLIFSGGDKTKIKVPNLVGMNYQEIMDNLDDYKDFEILLADETVFDEAAEDKEVMVQKPEAGEKAKKGDKIILTINDINGANADYLIPNFKGYAVKDVIKQLLNDDVAYTQVEEESNDIDAGIVIRTEPDRGETLPSGEKLTIVVSSGKGIVTAKVPSLMGMNESKAKKALENVGLELGKVTEREDSGVAGVVIDQSVAQGVKVEEGTSIDIVISKQKEQTPEPTPTPDPDDTPVVEEQKNASLNIALPQDGRETARVVVKIDNKTIYDKTHNTNEVMVTLKLKGTGSQLAVIEVDGERSEQLLEFN